MDKKMKERSKGQRVKGIVTSIIDWMDRTSSNRILALIVLYKVLMDITYVLWISRYYTYIGMTYEFDALKLTILYLIFLLSMPFIIAHCKVRKNSDYIMIFFDFMYFIPGLTFYSFKECSWIYILYYTLFYFLLLFVNELLPNKLPKLNVNKLMAKGILLALIALTLFYVITLNGFNIKIDLSNVYENRRQYAQNSIPFLFRYLKNPMANIIPILVYVCLKHKKYMYGFLLIILQLSIFSMGANKINLFFLIIAIGISFVEVSGKVLSFAFCGLMVVSTVLSCIKTNPVDGIITDMLIRRMMILPNWLSLEYFDFFQDKELLFLRTSLFDFAKDSLPYDREISYVMGEVLGTGGNMNNGMAGDAYANFGWYALLIYPMLFGIILFAFNWVTQGNSRGCIILSALIIAIIYIDSNYFTSLLTHGVAMILVIQLLLPKEKGIGHESKKSNC